MALIRWQDYNSIVIIGLPATGKTWLTATLPSGYKIYHTDDYMKFDWEDSLYALMEDMRRDKAVKVVVEGVQGYRLLRKLAERKMKQPDLIVKCVAPIDVRDRRYQERGKKASRAFDNTLSKIWMDYVLLVRDLRPSPKCFMFDTMKNEIIGDQIL